MVPVTVWRWVDVSARPDLVERNRRRGPLEGTCPSCGVEASAKTTWLEIDPAARRAVLVLCEDRRGDVIRELQAHLEVVRRFPERASLWLMTPSIRFSESAEENTARRHVEAQAVPRGSAGAVSGELRIPTPVPETESKPIPQPWAAAPAEEIAEVSSSMWLGEADGATESAPSLGAGVPQPIGADVHPEPTLEARPSLGAFLADLRVVEGCVRVRAEVDEASVAKWKDAKIDVRPIHLRGRGYPLLGVRVIASYMGQVGCVDAVIDVGDPLATEAFRALSQDFAIRFELCLPGEAEPSATRDVAAPGMEPNAALCIESARGLLVHGEYPPHEYENARRTLAREPVETRLRPAAVTIAPGAYQHVVGAAEAVAALEHLDRVSRKDALSRLLEVDGLPMGEYDAIRRRVLKGSLEHGLVAPRRFWRRVVASGLVTDYGDYAARLALNRVAHEGQEGDLDPQRARAVWEDILDLCRRKDLSVPEPVKVALNLPDDAVEHHRSTSQTSAAGEIRSGDDYDQLGAKLRDPKNRLKAATEVLQGRFGGGQLDAVFGALDLFDTDELLALLPDLSELGPRATAGLVAKLQSDRREVRQAAVILLGMSLDPDALESLADLLVREHTNVWLDVARALGAFGPVALRRLCQILRREAGSPREQQSVARVARALAEIALSDTDVGAGDHRPGHDAVAALADANDSRVSAAARQALATLKDVRESGAVIRGELPLAENTEIRGFARRAYEAIMVPELEVEVDA
jgi:predicted Fe-S protein YdhL (DUF1289 family)